MRRFRIGPRLTLSFAIIVLLTFLGSAIGVWQFMQVREQAQRLHQVNTEAIAILRINNDMLELKDELERLVETEDAAQFSAGAQALSDSIMQDAREAIVILENSPAKAQESRYTAQLRQLADVATLPNQIDLMTELAEAGDWPAVRLRLENQVEQVSQNTQTLVEEIGAIVATERQIAQRNMEQAQQQAFAAISIAGLLTLLSAGVLGFAVTRSIAQPLADLMTRAKALARREFDPPIAISGHDELAGLSQAFEKAADRLAGFYTQLEELVEQRTQELQQSTEELQYRYLQLETSIAVGQHITSILDLDRLLNQVVELIKERFGYHYVGVFLLDERGDYVVARAGTGEAGRLLQERGFRLKIGEEGIIGWVARHGRLARIDNVAEDNRFVPVDIIPNTKSELALPLAMGGTILGVLDIQSEKVRAFRLDDLPVWESLANQVASAIQNASLYQREKSRRQLAETVYDVGRAISQTLDLDEVLNLILEHLAGIVPYDRAAVMLKDKDELEIVASKGFSGEVKPAHLKIPINEDDVFQEIYKTQQPLIIPDVLERPDWQHVAGLPQARAWLGLPLNRFNKVIGMISLTSEAPNAYTSDQARLAATFASQAAIALENARLYDKITRFTQQLEDMIRERTEAVQKAYIQLEHLDRTKSDFIKIAAHELRTPLTVLRGYSKMLLTNPQIQKNSSQQQLVSGIHSGTMRLQEVVNSMLDVTKIDNRALELYPEPLAIESLIQLVCQEFTEAVAERNQTLIIKDMSHLPAIDADPEALPKVFQHLIVNAIKYTPDGGTITISGRPAEDSPKDNLPAEGIELVVSDTGIGIDPEYHELIFTKFYQTGELALHSTGKTQFKASGPGLGLAIARGIVEAHGGKIWVESPSQDQETCPGSKFYIFLPLRQKEGKKPVPTSAGTVEFANLFLERG